MKNLKTNNAKAFLGLLAVLFLTGLVPTLNAAPRPGGKSSVDGIFDYISVKATINNKNVWYLGSDLIVLDGQEVFDLNKNTYEYTTQANEIYIFPTLTTDAMFSGIVEGPSYSITVNDAKSEKPYTYPLKRGDNTFVIKVLEGRNGRNRVLETYTIKINSGNTTAAAPTRPNRPARGTPSAAGSFDYWEISNDGIITAVTSAANAREQGQVFISGNILTFGPARDQKILNADKDKDLIAIAANANAGPGGARASDSGWLKVQTLTVDGSNNIQEIVVVPQTSPSSTLNAAQLNNFLLSAKKVTITGEKNGTHDLNCTQAQADSPSNAWTTVTIPAGTILNLKAPASGNAPVIRFGGYLTLVVNGTVESESTAGKIAVTNTVTVKKGFKSAKGPGGDAGVTGSAFQGWVNGL